MVDSRISPPHRVVVLGCSGSGKSTLAAKLSQVFGLPYIATDPMFWTGDWQPVPIETLRRWLEETTRAQQWITDGNFDSEREMLWGRADLAVWLDLPFIVTLTRVAKRNLTWWFTRKRVWGGQRMSFTRAWSGIRHTMLSHGLKRRTYPAMLQALPNLTVIRIRSSRALADWLDSLQSSSRNVETQP